jgi:uncharacterized protein
MPHEQKRQVSIIINNKCNLNCVYCYAKESQKSGYKNIDIDFAKVGISDYFSKGNHQIRFFSLGEPTLDFSIIVELYNYAKKIAGDNLIAEIQTNGVMTEDKAHWLGQHINNIWISWDGPPYFQNAFRKTLNNKETSNIIEHNAKIMLKYKDDNHKNGFVGARVTITGKSIKRQQEIIRYFKERNITVIYSDPVFIPVGDSRLSEIVGEIDLIDYCKSYITAFNYAKSNNVFYGSFYMINFDDKCNSHCRACLPTPHLTLDGYVSCCDMALDSKINHMSQLIYGYWNVDSKNIVYDNDRIKYIQTRRVENIPECKHCDISNYCGGYCIGEVLNETKSFYGVLNDRCKAIRFLADGLKAGNVYIPVLHP